MYRIGLSSCSKTISEELFENYAKSGISAMEVSLRRDGYDKVDFDTVRRLSQKHGVELWSLHLPFSSRENLDISRSDLADGTVKYNAELIKRASEIGIQRFILHSSSEPITPEDRQERMKRSKQGISYLVEVAKANGAVIALENLPRTCLGNCVAEMLELTSIDPSVRVCFDTNHLLTEDPIGFIRKLGDKIITLHVSDYDFVDEKHWLPGEGQLDWQAILKALAEVNYDGVWMYELSFSNPRTLTRSRDLTCEDFYRNATEIFEGRTLTVIK